MMDFAHISRSSQRGPSPVRWYAKPRPLKRGGYLVRSFKAVLFLRVVEASLKVVYPKHLPSAVPAKPTRILVCNWAHVGDVLLSLPAIQTLKHLFPEAEIDLIIGRWSASVVNNTGLYHRIHFVDHFMLNRAKIGIFHKLYRYVADRRAFLRATRDTKYDVAIDLYFYFPVVSPLLWQSKIPVRCGFDSGGFSALLTHPVEWSFEGKSVGEFGLTLIKKLWPVKAASLATLNPCYPGYPQASSVAPTALQNSRYFIIHAGSGAQWREWPEQQWSVLVAALLERPGTTLVFCGVGRREGDRARRLATAMPSQCFVFLDQSWSDFVTIVAGAACVICLESSAAHLAAAFQIPTVAIYPGANEVKLWGPNNPNARVVTAPTLCAPCHRNSGCDAMACVRNVQPADVLAALDDLGLGLAVPSLPLPKGPPLPHA